MGSLRDKGLGMWGSGTLLEVLGALVRKDDVAEVPYWLVWCPYKGEMRGVVDV